MARGGTRVAPAEQWWGLTRVVAGGFHARGPLRCRTGRSRCPRTCTGLPARSPAPSGSLRPPRSRCARPRAAEPTRWARWSPGRVRAGQDPASRSEHERVAGPGRHTERDGALSPAALSIPRHAEHPERLREGLAKGACPDSPCIPPVAVFSFASGVAARAGLGGATVRLAAGVVDRVEPARGGAAGAVDERAGVDGADDLHLRDKPVGGAEGKWADLGGGCVWKGGKWADFGA
eukprot:scaffold17147_cov155-Isochrysis_galbana.AAC.1